jgi:hypothetical protein
MDDAHLVVGPQHERAGDGDVALGPEQADMVAVRLRQAAQDERGAARAEIEQAPELLVDALGAAHRRPAHRDRRSPEHPARDVDAVRAHVVQRPTAVLGHAANVAGIADREREHGDDGPQLSDRPLVEQAPDDLPLGVEAVHERLHPHDAARGAVVDHGGRLGRVERRRLLAQDVLARVGRPRRPLGVEVVRERNVDRVDVRVGEQPGVGPMQPHGVAQRSPVGRREPGVAQEARAGVARAGKRDELGVAGAQDGRDHHLAPDVRGADDADANAVHGSLSSGGRG